MSDKQASEIPQETAPQPPQPVQPAEILARQPPASKAEGTLLLPPVARTEVQGKELFQRHHNLIFKVSSLVFERESIKARLPMIERELSEIRTRSDKASDLVTAVEEIYKPGPAKPTILGKRPRTEKSATPLTLDEARQLGGEELASAVQALRETEPGTSASHSALTKSAKRREREKAKLLEQIKHQLPKALEEASKEKEPEDKEGAPKP